MIPFYLSILSAYSIGIAAIVGLVRFRKIDRSYRPFIYICLLALLNEGISMFFVYLFRNNNYNYNIYGMVEAMLYCWLFQRWGHFSNKKRSYLFTIILLGGVWITDNLVWHSLGNANSLFLVVYSFSLIFLAINEINIIVMSRRGNLLKDARFLICAGIVVFYTYSATIAVFYLFELNFSEIFYRNIYMVLQAVNFLINLVFALALLWAPRNRRFILQF